MGRWVTARDDPTAADVRALLAKHLEFASRHSPPDEVYVLDPETLATPDVAFFSIRHDGLLVGVGALKHLDPAHAELKSMHTAESARGQGIGRAMVEHLVGIARDRGCRRVSLETGSMEPFAPARALYSSVGFEVCEPFGAYRPSPHSVCMTLVLSPE